MRQDLRFAVRLMIKAPGLRTIAVVTLALGVGASTAIFSQINAVFWKPLPVANPHELRWPRNDCPCETFERFCG